MNYGTVEFGNPVSRWYLDCHLRATSWWQICKYLMLPVKKNIFFFPLWSENILFGEKVQAQPRPQVLWRTYLCRSCPANLSLGGSGLGNRSKLLCHTCKALETVQQYHRWSEWIIQFYYPETQSCVTTDGLAMSKRSERGVLRFWKVTFIINNRKVAREQARPTSLGRTLLVFICDWLHGWEVEDPAWTPLIRPCNHTLPCKHDW